MLAADLAVEVDPLLIVSPAAVELGRSPEGAEEIEAQIFEDLLIAGRVELDGVRRHRIGLPAMRRGGGPIEPIVNCSR